MQEFFTLYQYVDNPTLAMVLFTFLLSFVLSGFVAFTYEKTSNISIKSLNYIQSLVLASVVATMIMQAIGDNVAVGLGMIGALTIIQFRTTFRDPRDIIFMFACLGIGIACGVFGFYIAITGALVFCLIAILMRFSPFHKGNHVVWELRLKAPTECFEKEFYDILNQYTKRYDLDQLWPDVDKTGIKVIEMELKVLLKDDNSQKQLMEALSARGIQTRKWSRLGESNNDIN
ncbi:MAG: DUF4956 domain-containing protein [Saprospiraceae bacterium]|nr:DUF4956 domain-containing protein [Saprospiraceae bacterium]